MKRLVVPRYDELREKIDAEFPQGPLHVAALAALDDAATVRAIKDYVAEVEHPLQQQLFQLHQDELERYKCAALAAQDRLFEIGTGFLRAHIPEPGSVSQHSTMIVDIRDNLFDAFLEARSVMMEEACVLVQLRSLEGFCCEVGSELKWAGSAQVDSARKLDDELLHHMETVCPNASPDLGQSTSLQRERSKFLMEEAGRRFKTPTAIQRISYRPYDPDAVFPPNLCLSRPNARSLKPSDITSDICCTCTNVIGEYGKAATRAHCLDCDNGYNAVCGACFCISQSAVGALLSGLAHVRRIQKTTLDEDARDVYGRMLEHFIRVSVESLETLSPHTFHHSSGITEQCMSYTHANVAQRYANLQETITAAFSTYRDRPIFGIIVQEKAVAAHVLDLDQPVTLEGLQGTYRQWKKISLQMQETPRDEATTCAEDALQGVLHAAAALLGFAPNGAAPAAKATVVDVKREIPLTMPMESWRVPSDAIRRASERYAASPDGALSTKWVTFGEIGVIVDRVHNEVARLSQRCGDRVVLSVNDSPLWYSLELGIVHARRCCVGLFPLWEPRDLLDAMALSNASLGIVDVDVFQRLYACVMSSNEGSSVVAKLPQLLVVVVTNKAQMDFVSCGQRALSSINSRVICSALYVDQLWNEICAPEPWFPERACTADPPVATTAVRLAPTDETFAAIAVFTSGTSGGKPKGVTTTARQFQLECVDTNRFFGICDNAISAYAPSWATDKHNVWRSILRGGRVHFHCKSRSIFESFMEARPTPAMSVVPFLANQLPSMLEAVATEEIARLTAELQAPSSRPPGPFLGHDVSDAVRRAITAQAYATATYHMVEHLLGGRVYILSVGGAAVRSDILSFLRRNTPCYVMENYGLTECGGVLRDNRPFPGSLVKLLDRPDLGYTTADVPFPRGEFAVKNMDIATTDEWICDAEAKESIQARYLPDGYFLTGDIGLQRPDGSYEVIDRVSAVRKLANGKFFSPERVEQTTIDFSQSLGGMSHDAVNTLFPPQTQDGVCFAHNMQHAARCIRGCFIAADDNDHATIRMLLHVGTQPSDNIPDGLLIELLALLVKTACSLRGIPRDEVPVEYFLEDKDFEWSPSNGCLTASRKPNRKALSLRLEIAQERAPLSSRATGTCATAGVGSAEVIRDIEDVAIALLKHLVPNPPRVSRGAPALRNPLPELGCDSLVLSRIPRLMSQVLQRLRCALDPMAPGTICDVSELPSMFLTTPSLMRASPMSLASAVWRTTAPCGNDEDQQGHGQPFFSRQGSIGAEEVVSSQPTHCTAIGMAGGAARSSSTLFDAPPEAPTEENSSTPSEGPRGLQDRISTSLQDRISAIEVSASAEIQREARAWARTSSEAPRPGEGFAPGFLNQNACVLLTGPAGYFGSCVLHALLDAPWCGRVLCLVRPSRAGQGPRDRVLEAIIRMTPSHLQPSMLQQFHSKVEVVLTDLELPWFGMGAEAYDSVFRCRRIDAIVHAAAMVKSWSLETGLEALGAANVDATVRMAQLAVHNAAVRDDKSPTPIVHVSTVSVMKSQDVVALDSGISWKRLSEFHEASLHYYDAYSGTKLMAENALREWCLVTCTPLRIYRLPLLTWHTETGAENNDDWMNRLLDGVLSTRLAPLSDVFVEGTHYAPVDRAALHLVREVAELLRAESTPPMRSAFRVIYPYHDGDTINIRSVLRVVEKELSDAIAAAQTATLLNSTESIAQRQLFSERLLLGKLLWVPAYAWKSGLDALTLTLPTRYHPLLERGVMELQRAAGVRPIHPQGAEEVSANNEVDTEDLRKDAWVVPLQLYLREHYFLVHP
jgi:thioester reductase-like protein/long-subunit acyl-CoA synthetase (AMP-forming)